jgi:glycosyltransferase involved in cell wall biosynthesis
LQVDSNQNTAFYVPFGPKLSFIRKILQSLRIDKGGRGKFAIIMNKQQYRYKKMLKERDARYVRDLRSLVSVNCTRNLVSIILPVFNGENYIPAALDSIMSQSYVNWELIIVDDGSTDSTADIISSYMRRDSRITYVHQHNKKLPCALNTGHELAKGEFITWTSHDNVLRNDFLEVFVSEMNQRLDVDMLFANFELINESDTVIEGSCYNSLNQYPLGSGKIYLNPDVSVLHRYNFVGAAFMYRKRVYDLIGGYAEHWFTCEDYDYFLRVNAQMKLRHTKHIKPIYQYRLHSESLSSKKNELNIHSATKRLQILDDSRWDIGSGNIAWRITSDANERSNKAVDEWKSWILQWEDHKVDEFLDNEYWQVPSVQIYFISSDTMLERCTASNNSAGKINILVITNSNISIERSEIQWDLILHWLPNENSAHSNTKRPVIASDSLKSLWHACRIKAMSNYMYTLEIKRQVPFECEHKISIIVCTNREPKILQPLIDSMNKLSPDTPSLEFILVNNSAGRYSYVSQLKRLPVEEHESIPYKHIIAYPSGLSYARNAGIEIARGEILTFLDDDVEVNASLFAEVVKTFDKHHEIGVIGGAIDLHDPEPNPWWYGQNTGRFWSRFNPMNDSFHICSNFGELPYGANWSCRRECIQKIGGFRARFGRGGKICNSHEEIVAGTQIMELGIGIGIAPAARVLHLVDPHRIVFSELVTTIIQGSATSFFMSMEERIPSFIGIGRGGLRGITRLLGSFKPRPISLPSRLENFIIGISILRLWFSLLANCIARCGKHPTMYD